ncbi:MAG: hypothetical protein JST92_15895 [Deltaproteobacteria bacterium]|nr:hypothetical protein [Deltaproteobacteria bacterium]
MFIGHYGVSLAAKRVEPRLSLGVLFVAVQLLDVLFTIFVLGGVEKLRIVPGFTAVNSYDLYFMPFTHSLVGALLWSAADVALAWVTVAKGLSQRTRAALLVGAAVFSHFVLDVFVHTPDLPVALSGEGLKLGLGLWRSWPLTLALELVVFAAGALLYSRATAPRKAWSRRATLGFLAFLALLLVTTPFMPPPKSDVEFAVQALAAYLLLAGLAEVVDRSRGPVERAG